MTKCICCHGTALQPVITCRDVPVVANALAGDGAAARAAPTGDVELVVCETCGLVFNQAFDPAKMDYAPEYENALHHSPSFQSFADGLVADLVARHGLAGKRVVEIGCGDGYMLSRLVAAGAGQGVGFDPSMAGRESAYARAGMTIVPSYFDAGAIDGPFDAVICRHVLEHLSDPGALLTDLRAQIGDRPVTLYMEVPNADWMLTSVSIWDVIYEHVSYWTQPAIETLLVRCGFTPTRIRAGYGDQFLMVEATVGEPIPDFVADGVDYALEIAQAFGAAANRRMAEWRTRLEGRSGPAVLWGAGSKGITFANTVGVREGGVVAMVDLNPRKHGRCVPGAGLPVVAPDRLTEIRPDLVLISNGHYQSEIRERLAGMGLTPELWVITQ